jgi:hypothetical protein
MEGAFTRVAKIALVNALDARALCDLLFGRKLPHFSFALVHGRSFLSGTWAAPKVRGITGRSVLPGFLTSLCSGWATAIADDSRLRLCRSCADVGYQSALFQIDALSACPIHGEPLLEVCSHCNAPTPRYALSQEAFLSPMQCTECGAGYGRAWNGTADFAKWTGPGDLAPLKRLGHRLRSLQSLRLEWPTASTWIDDPSGVPAMRRRIHVFQTLMALSGAEPATDSVVTTRTCACLPAIALRQPPREEPRIAIYKAIRRHIIKRLGFGWLRKGFRFHDLFYRHRVNEAVVPIRARCIPELHAIVMWTTRCEDLDSYLMTRWRPGVRVAGSAWLLRLRTSMLRWPTEIQVPDGAWGHFIWNCFLEDLWTARRWQALVAPLDDPLEQADQTSTPVQSNRAAFLEHLAAWTPKMSPLLEPFPSGISHFTWQQGRVQRQFGLVTTHRFEGAWYDNPRNATNA